MGKPAALSREQALETRRLYEETDTSVDLLAVQFKVSYSTMRNVLASKHSYASLGPAVRVPTERYQGNQKISPAAIERIRALWTGGAMGLDELAQEYGVSVSTIDLVVQHKGRFADAVKKKPRARKRADVVAGVDEMMYSGRTAKEIVDFVLSDSIARS